MPPGRPFALRGTDTPLTDRSTAALAGVAFALAVAHVALFLNWRVRGFVPDALTPVLSVVEERGAMTWLTVVTSTTLAAVAWVGSRVERSRALLGLAALFAFLSFDDATMLHERVGWMVEEWVERNVGEDRLYEWMVPYLPVLAVLGGAVFLTARRALRGTPGAVRLVEVGFLFLGLALGLELVSGMIEEAGRRWRGFLVTEYLVVPEELLEALGPVALLRAVGRHAERRLRAGPEPASRSRADS